MMIVIVTLCGNNHLDDTKQLHQNNHKTMIHTGFPKSKSSLTTVRMTEEHKMLQITERI